MHNNADFLRALVGFLDNRPEYMNDNKEVKYLIEEYSSLTGVNPVMFELDSIVDVFKCRTAVCKYGKNDCVQLGDKYYTGRRRPLPCRWVTEDDFQVHYEGRWRNAYPSDWKL